jgi:hypothetical protein
MKNNSLKILLFVLIVIFSNNTANAEIILNLSTSTDSSSATAVEDTSNYVPLSQFTYAGEPRYTLNGSRPLKETKIRTWTATYLGAIYIGGFIGLHIHQRNAWWSGQSGSFHFQEDFVSALQVDKCGHAYGAYTMSYYCTEGLLASGVGYDNSFIWGTALGLGYQTFVEYEDGLAKDWGFSPSDFYFDAIGSMYFLAQHYVPVLQNITPKWQYIPCQWSGKPVIGRPSTPIDDYNSSTFWYSVKVYNFLPADCQKYWPKWLNIAIGYGADAIDVAKDPNAPPDQLSVRRYVIGLDYDLVALLPDGDYFWNWMRQNLNYLKFPAPSVEFSKNGTKFYIAYPFKILF